MYLFTSVEISEAFEEHVVRGDDPPRATWGWGGQVPGWRSHHQKESRPICCAFLANATLCPPKEVQDILECGAWIANLLRPILSGTRFWKLTTFRQSEHYRIKLVYQARSAVALSDLVDRTQLSRRPLYLSVLKEWPPVLSNNLLAFVCAIVRDFVTHV